jgi:hypothetical protein
VTGRGGGGELNDITKSDLLYGLNSSIIKHIVENWEASDEAVENKVQNNWPTKLWKTEEEKQWIKNNVR